MGCRLQKFCRPNALICHKLRQLGLAIIDEFKRENLTLEVGHKMTSEQVIDYLANLILLSY